MKKIFLILMMTFLAAYGNPVKENRVDIREPVEGNLVSASGRLSVNGKVEKSIVSASRYIDINEDSKNIVAAAEKINITGDIKNLLVSASRSLTVNGDVGDSVIAAADNIFLRGDTGDVIVAAREVDINGEIDNLYVAADRVYISGRVKGNIYSTTQKIDLLGEGEIGGRVYYSKEVPATERRVETPKKAVKKGYKIFRIGTLVYSVIGMLIISILLKKIAPEMTEDLSEKLFKKGGIAFLIGLFFIITIPVFILAMIPILGLYSLGIMSGYLFIFILSKGFLVAALSVRYNYILSLIVVAGLSYFYLFSFIFSVLGFGIFLLFIKGVLSRKPELKF